MGRYEEAIATFKKALALNPNFLAPHITLAGIYNLVGREEEARAEADIVLRISPDFSVEGMRQRAVDRDQVRLESFLAALRKAGLK
jgi:tetratricopeptide (TPR) repeat protein